MRFPNAKKGIRNIFRSEIIMLFFDLATAIVSIIVMVAGADLNKIAFDEISGLTLVFMILGLVALLSLLIGGIFRIVGFLQAARDDQGFRLAIFFTLSAVLFNFAQSFFQTKEGALGWVHAILSVLGVIAQMLVTVYAIGGMMNLSRKSHRDDLVGKGKTIRFQSDGGDAADLRDRRADGGAVSALSALSVPRRQNARGGKVLIQSVNRVRGIPV